MQEKATIAIACWLADIESVDSHQSPRDLPLIPQAPLPDGRLYQLAQELQAFADLFKKIG
jgi:hypothetical protein